MPTTPIVRPTSIPFFLRHLDVWVVSFGGCGSNMLADFIKSKGLSVYSHEWHSLLCHHEAPLTLDERARFDMNIKIIYVFSNPIEAIKSQKRQHLLEVNYKKLTNRANAIYPGHSRMLEAMQRQFDAWTAAHSTPGFDILCVNYDHIFENVADISEFLGVDATGFPVRRPRSSTRVTIVGEPQLRRRFAGFLAATDATVIHRNPRVHHAQSP
jgi:hypothetical protein